MIYDCEKLTKWLTCIVLTLLYQVAAAQTTYIQKAIDKLEGCGNFSYRYDYKQKEYADDTLLIQHKDIFQKAPEDKTYGYFFSLETLMKPNKYPRTEYYNGKIIVSVYPGDSTYYTKNSDPSILSQSLIQRLYWLKGFLEKKPSNIVKVADTTSHGVDSDHFIINTRDTIINKEHYYSRMHVYIDKSSNLPVSIVGRAKYENPTGEPTSYYSEAYYFDYKFNHANINIASTTIPPGYHLPKSRPALLAPGTVAPDWTLQATTGKQVSLSQLKGRVVLMDFYFIGCHNCLDALASLNNLHEKYKGRNFVIASITGRDKLKSVLQFDKTHHIKYPSYVNGADVVKAYHVEGFPTFYFIDKEGKVANVTLGYDKDFEAKATSIIDALLKK